MTRRVFLAVTAAVRQLPSQRSVRIVELLATAGLNLNFAFRLRDGERLVFEEASLRGRPAFRLAASDRAIGYILRQQGTDRLFSAHIHSARIDSFGRRRILVRIETAL